MGELMGWVAAFLLVGGAGWLATSVATRALRDGRPVGGPAAYGLARDEALLLNELLARDGLVPFLTTEEKDRAERLAKRFSQL